MPGDELHDEGAAAGARSGRHAAPRKPLLTRLHVPAGKAIAIAAMPSAVLMGMGLTPQLAMAKPKPPESPFRDGPCVTAPDKVEDKDAKDKAEDKDKKDDAKDGKETEPSAKPSASPSGTDGDKTSEPSDEPSDSATPSPSASPEEEEKDGGLLGGVGDALGGLLGGGDSSEEESTASPSPSPSESESATESASKDDTAGTDDSATGKVTKPVEDTVDGVKDGVGKAGESLSGGSKAVNDTVHGAVGTVDNALPGGGLDGTDANGKKGYPCVVENKQKGKDEQTPVTLPDDPWHLESSALTLRGLNYEGVVNVTTQNGSTKQALKFTADSVDIGDLHQIVDDPTSGKKYHVQARKGSTSTIRGGKVTMYTEKLQGNLFGLIPVTFDPEHPPPLNTPFAYFTKVKIDQAGQFGGNLHVPGLQQYMT
ncbi:hypothetical protein [Streptomyces purpurogeneiscleroticus]|uniref:hypothetical protein n=1 Tax=Streptomyces purpurogeneiscleroticus TaxID=68259 RepID=UPI001CBBE156|nr:hypothetical protein [Streptomyces purpurogeneiscleroticus]MBZ4020620.1 hypothetical protein [Streptomyces purpurogeneiscleroticus]